MNGLRSWYRRLKFGLPTVFGLHQYGIFIPYRHANDITKAGCREAYHTIEAMFASRQEVFGDWLSILDGFSEALENIEATCAPPEPRWGQDWFPRLDGAMAYSMVRKLKPKRIVEIGSGHSTRFFARAISDSGLDTQIIAIDPAPRASLSGLEPVQLLLQPLQKVGLEPFFALKDGDILAIDSSHILAPGSDVDMFQNRILPILPKGVTVQVHDVFLPDDYPVEWGWRGYNEQLGLASLLQACSNWKVEFASHYVATRMPDEVEAGVVGRLPLPTGAYETGLWMRKT